MTAMTYPTIFSQVALLSPMYNENIKQKFDTCMNKRSIDDMACHWFRRRRFYFTN